MAAVTPAARSALGFVAEFLAGEMDGLGLEVAVGEDQLFRMVALAERACPGELEACLRSAPDSERKLQTIRCLTTRLRYRFRASS